MRDVLEFGYLGAGHLPVCYALTFTAAMGVTYCLSVYRGDVDPLFPYISASADNRPEACFFSLLMNSATFFLLASVYSRFHIIRQLNRGSDELLRSVNIACYYVGLVHVFGLFFIANVPETVSIWTHLAGALLYGSCGCAHMIGQAWCSLRMYPLFCGKRIPRFRVALAVGSTTMFVVALVFGGLAIYAFHDQSDVRSMSLLWNHRTTGIEWGYVFHSTSAVAEWLVAAMQIGYFLTYSREFEKLRIRLQSDALTMRLDTSPVYIPVIDEHDYL